MTGVFFQLAITVWLSAHPVRDVQPKVYFGYEDCERAGKRLASRQRKAKPRLEIECVFTDRRGV